MRFLVPPHLRPDHQGIPAAAPRPADLGHDHRHPLDAASSVRLRDQSQSQGSAHRGFGGRSRHLQPFDRRGTGEFQLFQHHHRDQFPRCRPPSAAGRQGHFRGRDSGQFHPRHRSRRPARSSDRSRCHRPGRRLLCLGGLQRAGRHGPARRSGRTACRPRPRPAALQHGFASTLQSGIHHPVQYHPGPAGHRAHHDHGADDLFGAHPRARTGHV